MPFLPNVWDMRIFPPQCQRLLAGADDPFEFRPKVQLTMLPPPRDAFRQVLLLAVAVSMSLACFWWLLPVNGPLSSGERTFSRQAQATESRGTWQPPGVATASRQGTAGEPAPLPRDGIPLNNLSWKDLEDELARLWPHQLIRSVSRDNQRATFHAVRDDQPEPVFQIDRAANRVVYLNGGQTARAWHTVIQSLDQPRAADRRQTELMTIHHADPQQVRQAVAALQPSFETEPGASAAALLQPAEPSLPPVTPDPDSPEDGEFDEIDDDTELANETGLIGPVEIEFVPGLDVIVLRGHRRDVERVQRIISDIERLSVETQPALEIHQLEHVGSQIMAELVSAIYDEILSPRQGQVTIRPLVQPNALLLIGRVEAVELVRDLVDRLDTPTAPKQQFEVFMLEHISAVDAAETINAFFVDGLGTTPQDQRPGLGARVNVVADFRTNALIVHASPRDMREVRALIGRIDVEDVPSKNELRVFRLRNTLATEIAPILQDALNWQLSGNRVPLGATPAVGLQAFGPAEETARLRTAILSFMTIDSDGGEILESGLLLDVRITADANGNALVVTGPAKSMDLIEALIHELDTLPAARAQIKVFTIVNGDATALANTLQQLLGQAAQVGQAVSPLAGISPLLAPGVQTAAIAGESALVPVRFGVDQRTNSIIATGSEGDLGVVEALLLRLDEESLRRQQTVVYWLSNQPAPDVAESVNQWIAQRTQLFQQQVQLTPESPDIRFAREVVVVPEAISNSIIISASSDLLGEVMQVVESLDRRPPMVKIDVLIAEVTLTDLYEFGTEFGLQDSLLFNRTYLDGGEPGFNFNNRSLGDVTDGDPGNLLGQGLSHFGVGRVSPAQGYGGLVLSASSDAVSMLLRALQDRGRAQILSRPNITTLDGQPANVNVGEITARPGEITRTQFDAAVSIREVQVGLLLGVTPRVTPDGTVVMEIDVERSRLDVTSVTINDNVIQNIRNAEASTTISARSGQTVVFAGLIETNTQTTRRGLPFLSDLPYVGSLFGYDTESERRSELLIVMTPRVIYGTDDEYDEIKRSESERMSWCLADVSELYGNVGFSARPTGGIPCSGPLVIYPHENPAGTIYHPEPEASEFQPGPAGESPHDAAAPGPADSEPAPPPAPDVPSLRPAPGSTAPPASAPYRPLIIDSSAGRTSPPAAGATANLPGMPEAEAAMPPFSLAPWATGTAAHYQPPVPGPTSAIAPATFQTP